MWIILTADHVQNSLSKAEGDTLTGVFSAAGLANIIQSVTSLIRGKVNSYSPNQGHLGPAGTIPDEALAPAISIARYKFLTTLPGTQLITKWREQENTEAYTLLDQIADGTLLVLGSDTGTVPQRLAEVAPSNPPGSGTGEQWFSPSPATLWPTPSWEPGYWSWILAFLCAHILITGVI